MCLPLCSVCSKLTIEKLVSEQGFALHGDLVRLHESSASCQLCSHAIERITSGNSALGYCESKVEYLTSLQARVFYGHHVHSKQGLTIVISHIGSQTPNQGEEFPWLLLRTLDGDPARRLGAKTARLVPESTSSPESTVQALKWLKECLLSKDCFEDCSHVSDHDLEQGLGETDGNRRSSSTLPESSQLLEQKYHQRFQLCKDIHTLYQKRSRSAVSHERAARLVEIIDIGSTVNLRLVDGSIECTPYVALSYRWGDLEAVWQTTTSNLESRLSGFSIDELPMTLSDTVKLTRDLGFKRIWIDSLCIVQDDKYDWAREAVKMAAIYQNAIVTIAADSSQGAKAGLHNNKSTSIFTMDGSIKISNKLSTGEESSIYLFPDQKTRLDHSVTSLRDMGDLLSHCSLRDRGWTLQERILSPRIIHYTSDQLYWECYHGIQESEDNLLWMGRNLTIPKIAHRVKSAKDVETKKQELNKVLYYWYVHLVRGDYSHRSLTYGEDKLVAIGGVAKALDDIKSMGYMVGHWGDDDDELVKSLCWKRGGPGQKAAKYRAPSWSWASQDSIVDYGSYSLVGIDDNKIVAEPVTWQASAPDGTFFGRCTNAYLQIKAKFVRGTVFPNCGHDFSEYHQAGIGGGCTVDPPKERCAFLMLEGGETSDLVWLDKSRATQDPVREGIDVKVVMLSEVRPEGEEPYPGACLICTLDERYYLTRIGFTEYVRPYKEGEDAPPVTGPKLCDKEAIELIII
ncbi:hypothetical protein HYE68_011067 [Fusarium pseudograminearum]|nr:hypothetical protein HYE68_011067 [Fusarium pseudograminearum]